MKSNAYEHIAAALYERCWMITEDKMDVLVKVFERRRAGMFDQGGFDEPQKLPPGVREVAGIPVAFKGSTAILPMHGVLSQRPSLMSKYSGGTSVEQFTAAHATLLADPAVKSVIWDVNSPGGSVYGVEEGFQRLYAMRGQKPTIAFSNMMNCSAAYYLSSAADKIVASPSSVTGNIGVIAPIYDETKKNENEGIKVEYVSAGKYKAEGYVPPTDEYRAARQQEVDTYYTMFVNAVAKGRRTTADAVRNGYGQGRPMTASAALSAGLVDQIGTIEVIMRSLGAYDSHGREKTVRAILKIAEATL